jgi:hypothetical protein
MSIGVDHALRGLKSNFTSRLLVMSMLAITAVVGVDLTTASPASAAWENCGDYICTEYLTRDETQAVSQYLNSVTPYSNGASQGFCAYVGSKGGGIGAALGAAACSGVLERYDWRPAAGEAVAHNACFQVAYSKEWWGKFFPSPGWTSHPSYCFD